MPRFKTSPAKGTFLSEDDAMFLAIEEGKRGAGRVSPNPLVGCVILDKDDGFLSSGYHAQYGGPHAEVNALRALSESELEGAKVYVTLEPCAHEGKTPSCAKALAKLPIHSVTYGLEDPNPIVNGQGAAILRAAGIKTSIFPQFQDELEELCEVFLHNMRFQKPFVSVKVASSLDGIMVLKSGESKWITGEQAREHSHFLRACHDGLLVGRNTIEQDDPSLNIRHPQFMDKENKVIILDPNAQLAEKIDSYAVSRSHKMQNLFLVVRADLKDKLPVSAAQYVYVKYDKVEGLDFPQMLTQMWQLGIKSVLVEGGALTLSSFIKENLAQRLYLFQAPILLGNGFGRSWSESVTVHEMTDRIHIKNRQITEFGDDLLITGRF